MFSIPSGIGVIYYANVSGMVNKLPPSVINAEVNGFDAFAFNGYKIIFSVIVRRKGGWHPKCSAIIHHIHNHRVHSSASIGVSNGECVGGGNCWICCRIRTGRATQSCCRRPCISSCACGCKSSLISNSNRIRSRSGYG